MIPEGDSPMDDEAGEETAPKSPERKILIWVAILFGTNLLCLLMLAARSESPPQMRGYFDVGIFSCLLSVATFAVVRFMFLYPFRLLDLVVMVITMSLGMKGAIAAAHWIRYAQYRDVFPNPGTPSFTQIPDASLSVLYVESCMLTACILMGGAALGLRNCRLLKIESPLKRAIVLIFGMAALPAPLGLVTIPFYLLHILMTEKQTTTDALGWIAALVFSGIAALANASFSIRTMALNTQNLTQESKWREK